MNKHLQNFVSWVKQDYHSNPLRFSLEMLAWAMSIGANIMFALTVPHVPFLIYLSITVTGCAIYAWCAWTRGSFGMLANYILLTTIDSIALSRVIIG
jgi:hypothetical protein